jgi:hypothetical protein
MANIVGFGHEYEVWSNTGQGQVGLLLLVWTHMVVAEVQQSLVAPAILAHWNTAVAAALHEWAKWKFRRHSVVGVVVGVPVLVVRVRVHTVVVGVVVECLASFPHGG